MGCNYFPYRSRYPSCRDLYGCFATVQGELSQQNLPGCLGKKLLFPRKEGLTRHPLIMMGAGMLQFKTLSVCKAAAACSTQVTLSEGSSHHSSRHCVEGMPVPVRPFDVFFRERGNLWRVLVLVVLSAGQF